MKKYYTLILAAITILIPFNLFSQFSGKIYITSNCASGGFDYYFFDQQTVISVCSGCEARPYVQYGHYTIKGPDVIIKMEEEWWGEGAGKIIGASNVNHYERYVARYSITQETFSVPINWFNTQSTESCEEISSHSYTIADPHVFLRNDLIGKYPDCSTRLLTDDDLVGKSKQELRLMRNEIFARYGYIFTSDDLKNYFQKHAGYLEFSRDVEAFLSDTEKFNIAKIKEYENR